MKNIKEILDIEFSKIDGSDFIINDPISIPHRFESKTDREIAGFIASVLAWGRRDMIIRSANFVMEAMENKPTYFLRNLSNSDLNRFDSFVYRTMNADDMKFIISSLSHLYKKNDDMEKVIGESSDAVDAVRSLRNCILQYDHEKRVERHLGNPDKNSACKRWFMFFRWMVRKDNLGIDFGIWNNLKSADLILPLDVHTANTSRSLGLLERKANDLKSAIHITEQLRKMDPIDPIRYDFSLFNLDL